MDKFLFKENGDVTELGGIFISLFSWYFAWSLLGVVLYFILLADPSYCEGKRDKVAYVIPSKAIACYFLEDIE